MQPMSMSRPFRPSIPSIGTPLPSHPFTCRLIYYFIHSPADLFIHPFTCRFYSILNDVPCFAQVNSVKDMRHGTDGRPPIAPNIEMTIRDKPHASRRLLSRPWACDPIISEMLDAILLGKHSILQKIEHSLHLQAIFSRHCDRVNASIHKKFGRHLAVRAAKHRFEFLSTPLSRLALWFPAFIGFAEEVMLVRGSDDRVWASEFLDYLTTSRLILIGLLADAADEGLLFTRLLDDPACDPATISTECHLFLVKVAELFHKRRVLDMHSHVADVLRMLTVPLLVPATATNPSPRSLGCRGGVSEDCIDIASKALGPWIKLCFATMAAEFPSFELLKSFSVFEVNEQRQPKGGIGDDAPIDRKTHMERLAHAFSLDEASLVEQFDSLEHVARNRMKHVGCSNFDAWAYAINRVKQRRRGRACHSTWDLEQVMHRYGTMSGNTSMVEQKFSVNAKIMNKHRLACAEATEEQFICMPINCVSMWVVWGAVG